jgi:hypothetical protein
MSAFDPATEKRSGRFEPAPLTAALKDCRRAASPSNLPFYYGQISSLSRIGGSPN